ncbi:MAG TPA: hypothetical protein VNO43_16260 [Candidatus Eisenbacteria bacterium]|nr:hypothetical protein [Candidatus Eisenbacteria bacterium]
MNTVRSLALGLILLAAAACTSPEASRVRGAGPGADVGNRTARVELHAGSQPYWHTPRLIPGEHPSLESSMHAKAQTRGR